MTAISTLTDFLLARIAEDEDRARSVTSWPGALDPFEGETPSYAAHAKVWVPPRVLAECEAKRRIVAIVGRLGGHYEPNAGREAPAILRALAMTYADHPDFQDEWRT